MTIAFTALGQGLDTSSTPGPTATITPATNGNPIAFLWMNTRGTGTAATAVTALAGLGLTWTSILPGSSRDNGVASIRVGLFQGIGTASSGTVALTVANSTGAAWALVQIAGANPTTPFVTANSIASTSTGNATSSSLTLPSTPSAGNAILAAVCHQASETTTPGTNYGSNTNVTMGTPTTAFRAMWKTVLDTTVDASWTTSSGFNVIGIEVAAASGDFVGAIPI